MRLLKNKTWLKPLEKIHWKKCALGFLTAGLLFMTICNTEIRESTAGLTYNDLNTIPKNEVGVLLGTSQFLKDGRQNLYFKYRIDAAADLYKAKKIEYILISGDNGRTEYNEPEDMKQALLTLGVPEDKIVLDYAGFRTYDSIVRANKIFGQTHFTIISQKFHNERAIYIAKRLGLNAIGYNAKNVAFAASPRIYLREKISRTAVFLDLFLNHDPKFLGDPIQIGT
jgi:SanA protein